MIRHLPAILLAAVLCTLTACRKDDLPLTTSASAPAVWLAGTAGAEAAFTLTAPASWTLTTGGDGYEVVPTSGAAGQTPITVRSLTENTAPGHTTLGSIVVHTEPDQTLRLEVLQRPATAPHAFLFVFIGTSLQRFFDWNLKAALAAMTPQIPGDGRVAALCYREGVWQIAELDCDPMTGRSAITTLKTFDHPDRSRPEFLTEVLNEMMQLIPASSYGVVFGGHGTGWVPKSSSRSGRSPAPRETTPPDPCPITRYFGEEGSIFDIDQIAASLQATGVRFEYLIFDDCFMSNIETLYSLRESSRYIVASPCEILGEGFPYGYVIPALFAGEDPTPERLQRVCEKFYNYYLSEYNPVYPSGCIALTRCDELEALADVSQQLFASASKTCDPSQLQSYEGMTSHLFYDFRQYAEQVATDAGALDLFREQFDRTFPPECRLHTPSFYSWHSRPLMLPINYYSGVTCSAPAQLYSTENRQTAWWRKVLGDTAE